MVPLLFPFWGKFSKRAIRESPLQWHVRRIATAPLGPRNDEGNGGQAPEPPYSLQNRHSFPHFCGILFHNLRKKRSSAL